MKAMAQAMHSSPPGEGARELAGEAAVDAVGAVAAVSAVASLSEPTRLRIYDHVRAQAEPVSRDDVAHALGLLRRTAAFQLDRLADAGLLVVSFERRSGRSGPGAGRPAKLYRPFTGEVSVSLPPRHYDLAGSLLAGALVEAEQGGEAPREVLARRARDLGRAQGGQSGKSTKSTKSTKGIKGTAGVLMRLLESHGYEPRGEGSDIILHNCPFHALAQRHPELVCGMNLHLLEGVLEGLGMPGHNARLDPDPSRCCVQMHLR
jgi:predicted ArsR family transcriptional regulator